MLMGQSIMETGKMISRKETERNNGLTGQDMKANIYKERNKEKVNSFGQMDQNTLEILN